MQKKVYVLSNGCPENRFDAKQMQTTLIQNGFIATDKIKEADAILFNTCALTKESERNSLQLIKQINSSKKLSAKLIVCGCLTKINEARLREVYQGPVFGSDEIEKLGEVLNNTIECDGIINNSLLESTRYLNIYHKIALNLKNKTPLDCLIRLIKLCRSRYAKKCSIIRPDTFYIKVSTGCAGNCSYCAIRLSRGSIKSRPIEYVVKEFENGLKRGYRTFSLIGTDLGAYGLDKNTDIVALLTELVKREGDYSINIRSIHPWFLINMLPKLWEIFKTGKVSYISSAVESGNNRILKLMNRGYTIEDCKEAIRLINKEFPQIKVRTQLMVGFPTETEEEFKDTMGLLDELRFGFVEIYIFQPRPQTRAALMDGQLPPSILKKRYLRLAIKSLLITIRGDEKRRFRQKRLC